jgi:ubiquinone/menaquinone biosynthesis C-methylase UbiE
VEALPYGAATFDRALTVHTTYFWPEPDAAFREMRRVIRPGGRFVLVFHEPDPSHAATRFPSPFYTFRNEAELTACARSAGWRSFRSERVQRGSDTMVWLVAEA